MKTMSKMIAAMMIMTITAAMPATANNQKKAHFDRVEKKGPHYDRIEKRDAHFDRHHRPAYRPDVKLLTIKLGRYESHRRLADRADRLKGVMDTKWNPRTRELIIIYDAKITSARHIRHHMA